MKILFRVLIGLVVLVVLVIGAAYFILTGYDREELKQIAQEQTKAATGRDLVINGDLDFKISLSPAITVEDVTFSNAAWGSEPQMAKIRHFELEVAILPLFSGDIEVNRLVLIEPEILLETDRSGKGNWELEMASAPAEETGEGGPASAKINAITIKDGAVTYRDGVTGETSVFTLDTLTGSAPSLANINVDASGNADGTPFSIDARLTQSGDSYAIDNAEITYGKTDLKGSGSLALGGARPKVTANFTSSMIDLAGLAPAEKAEDEAAAPAAASTSPYLFTEDPLPIGMLRSADADISIDVDTIRVTDTVDVTNAKIVMTLNNGDLNVSQLKGAAMKGTVDMTARLNGAASPAALTTSLKVHGLDYGEVLKTMDISEDVDGTIDIDVNLSGRGNSMRQIASSLNGSEQIVATDGVITNKLLAIVSTGLDEIMGPLMGKNKDTKLNCFINRFDISNGMATSRAFVVDSSTFTVGGEGTVDLRTEQLNLAFDTRTRDTALVSLAVPFRVKGTLASPNAYPDPLGTAKGAAKLAKGIGQLLDKDGGKDGDGGGKNPLGGLMGKLTGKDKNTETQEDAAPELDACAAAMKAIGR